MFMFVNITTLQEVPSTGFDGWYKLSGRSSKSQVVDNYLLVHARLILESLTPGAGINQTEALVVLQRGEDALQV